MPFSNAFLPAPNLSRHRRPQFTPRCTTNPAIPLPPSHTTSSSTSCTQTLPPPPPPCNNQTARPPNPRNRPTYFTRLILRHAQSGNLRAMQNAVRYARTQGFTLNAVNYTTIANAHVTHGDPSRVFHVLTRMRDDKVPPTNASLTVALKACDAWAVPHSSQEALMATLEWLAKDGIDSRTKTWNMALRTLVRKGAVLQAMQVLDWMTMGGVGRERAPRPDACSFNTCMLALGKQGRFVEAVDLFGRLLRSGIKLDVVSYNVLLETGILAKKLPGIVGGGKYQMQMESFVNAVVRSMERRGVAPNLTTETAMLRAMVRHNSATPRATWVWARAKLVLEDGWAKGNKPDKQYFDAVISAFGHAKDLNGVEFAFSKMLSVGILPDTLTIQALLVAANFCGDVALAVKILDVTYACGMPLNQHLYTTAIASCARSSPQDPRTADLLLAQALERGTPWTAPMINAAISTYGDDVSKAVQLWQKLRTCPDEVSRDVLKDRVVYDALMRVCGRGARPDMALRIFYAARKAEHLRSNSSESKHVYSAFKRGVNEAGARQMIRNNALKRRYMEHFKAECGITDGVQSPVERVRIKL
eukprot:GFKZ01001505.1.p1 GENE.GFKZ01001505.1~~GFKZ01001505.1.p1  ORF type:complete len:587 (-),score=54.60 GFKZ01001505.1:1043-2803(-)